MFNFLIHSSKIFKVIIVLFLLRRKPLFQFNLLSINLLLTTNSLIEVLQKPQL